MERLSTRGLKFDNSPLPATKLWVKLREASSLIEHRHQVPVDQVHKFLIRAVEKLCCLNALKQEDIYKFRRSKAGWVQRRSVSPEDYAANRLEQEDLLLSHRVSHWDHPTKQWTFRNPPYPETYDGKRIIYGMEIDKRSGQVRVFDWDACLVDWDQGTVRNWSGFRGDIEVRWRDVSNWAEKLLDLGILHRSKASGVQRLPAGIDRRPRPTLNAMTEWFRKRKSGWRKNRPFPSEAVDWDAARAYFQKGIVQTMFREARRKGTQNRDGSSSGWHKPGPRTARKSSAKRWPFL